MLVGLIVTSGIFLRQTLEQPVEERRRDQLVDQIMVADIDKLPQFTATVAEDDFKSQNRLRAVEDNDQLSPAERLPAHSVLASTDKNSVRHVVRAVASARPHERTVFLVALTPHWAMAAPMVWEELLTAESESAEATLNLAALLAAFEPQSEYWAEVAASVTASLLRSHPLTLPEHVHALMPGPF